MKRWELQYIFYQYYIFLHFRQFYLFRQQLEFRQYPDPIYFYCHQSGSKQLRFGAFHIEYRESSSVQLVRLPRS